MPDEWYAFIELSPAGADGNCVFVRAIDESEAKAKERGLSRDTVLTLNDLVKSDNVFFAATGASDGDLLKAVGDGQRHRLQPQTTRPLSSGIIHMHLHRFFTNCS